MKNPGELITLRQVSAETGEDILVVRTCAGIWRKDREATAPRALKSRMVDGLIVVRRAEAIRWHSEKMVRIKDVENNK